MQGNQLFEYAVIRVVPRVEREEFHNVGVILYCGGKKFLKCIVDINEARLLALCPTLDMDDVKSHLASFEQICKGGNQSGPIGQLAIAERFRWLTATRSTVVQTSKVHPGLCNDPEEKLTQLYKQLVEINTADTR